MTNRTMIAGALLACCSGCSKGPQKVIVMPEPVKWEYESIQILPKHEFDKPVSDDSIDPIDDKQIVGAGKDGWEMVGIYRDDYTTTYHEAAGDSAVPGRRVLVIFKRPLAAETP